MLSFSWNLALTGYIQWHTLRDYRSRYFEYIFKFNKYYPHELITTIKFKIVLLKNRFTQTMLLSCAREWPKYTKKISGGQMKSCKQCYCSMGWRLYIEHADDARATRVAFNSLSARALPDIKNREQDARRWKTKSKSSARGAMCTLASVIQTLFLANVKSNIKVD